MVKPYEGVRLLIVVFDIGGTSVKYAGWKDNKLMNIGNFRTPATFNQLTTEMKKIINMYDDVKGIAISSPGAVNVEKRCIEGVSAIKYLHNRPIFSQLEEEFNLPVSIENDAVCAGIAEMSLGAGKSINNSVFIVIGTGIGGSIFINRKVYKGSHLFGGEFGLMKLDSDKNLSLLATAVHKAEEYSSVTGNTIDGKKLFKLAKAGDIIAQEYLNQMYDAIAKSLYNIQVILDPEIIIIGGGISTQSIVIENIRTRLRMLLNSEKLDEIMPQIVACKYGNDANLIGAAISFELQFSKNNCDCSK